MNKTIKSFLFLSLAILATLVAGVAIGLLAGILGSTIYIVFLFPLGMGLAAGFVLQKTVAAARIRKGWQAVFLGCLIATAAYGTYHWQNYALFRGQFLLEMHQQLLAEAGVSDPEVASVMVDYALRQETGLPGFPGYLLLKARYGVTIGKAFRSGFNLGPFFTWVFWLLEWAIIGWVAVGMAKQAAARPFCEACGRWFGEERHLGGVGAALSAELAGLFERREFARAGEMLEPDAEIPSLEVYLQSCRHCSSSEAWLALKPVTLSENGTVQFQPGTAISIRPHERAGLLGALQPTAESAGLQA